MKVAKDDQLQSKQRKEALYIQVHTINKIKKTQMLKAMDLTN